MKKVLKSITAMLAAVLLAAALTACSGGDNEQNNTGNSGSSTQNAGSGTLSGEVSSEYRTIAALRLLDGNEYFLEMNFFDVTMQIARKGDMSSMGYSGEMFSVIRDGNSYTYMEEDDVWIINEGVTADDIFMNFAGMAAEVETAVYIGNGTAEFNGENYYYEEFEDNDTPVRFFFDGDMLIGMASEGTEEIFRLSKNIPDGMFDLPAGAVILTADEYNVSAASAFYSKTGAPGDEPGEVKLVFSQTSDLTNFNIFSEEYDIFEGIITDVLAEQGARYSMIMGSAEITVMVVVEEGAEFDPYAAATAICEHEDNPYVLTVQ